MVPLFFAFLLQTGTNTPPPVNIEDWTPRPATGKAEPWEKMRDPMWDDDRLPKMNSGPTYNATFKYTTTDNRQQMVMKGTAARIGDGGILFDRLMLKTVATWSGGYLFHSNKRFGLMNTPTPVGSFSSLEAPSPGWVQPNDAISLAKHEGTSIPLPKTWGRYKGMHRIQGGVTFEYMIGSETIYETYQSTANGRSGPIFSSVKPITAKRSLNTIVTTSQDIAKVTQPSPKLWGEPLVTKFVRGEENGPFAVDTLTIPYNNPFKALFFCTGVDFLADGRVAVCTGHGDVWLVTLDEAKESCVWQRFATGLYQPLGLKVVNDKIHVIERGQLTRLIDKNNDGEADFYECINNDWHTGGGEHAYDTCLETDPEGNFYFQKTGDTHLPHGGCVMKILADGSACEVFATGTRHPIGLGISPTGIITGADQEGNWMPASRVDQYKKGGFYGDMRAHHREVEPTIYDGPMLWLPREVDNSSASQLWVPENTFGPLAGLPLHLSYGRCKAFVLLRQELQDGRVQGGAWDINMNFLSGSARGRFHPKEKMLYVVGLNGWQTAAKADGSLQRVRTTNKPLNIPVRSQVVPGGVKLTFSQDLDTNSVANIKNYQGATWNYRWSKDYGSKRWRPSAPTIEGQDAIVIDAATLQEDRRTIFIQAKLPVPVMQAQLGLNVKTSQGDALAGLYTFTIHGDK